MDILDEINWSAVARKAFEAKIEEAVFLKQMAKKSKMTEKDAKALAKSIDESVAKKFLQK